MGCGRVLVWSALAACTSPARDFPPLPECSAVSPCPSGQSCTAGRCEANAETVLISGGFSHLCAKIEGEVLCWGAGPWVENEIFPRLGPHAIPAARDAVELSGGAYHHCARMESGEVMCFGVLLASCDLSERGAIVMRGATAIASGRDHVCAIHGNGRVLCWGESDGGRLGFERAVDVCEPIDPATGVPEGAISLAAGQAHTCALYADGRVFCFGGAYSKDGAFVDVRGAIRLAARYDQTLAVLDDGRVARWSLPDAVTYVDGIDDAIDVAAYRLWSCVLSRAGAITCDGQLEIVDFAAFAPEGGAVAERIALSANVGCFVERGSISCWGYGGHGELGDGSERLSPPTRVPNFDAQTVAPGRRHGCGLDRAGGVTCWGNNDFGMLGVADLSAESGTPIARGVRAIDGNEEHTCALLESGGVSCWGRNDDGRIRAGAGRAVVEPLAIELGAEVHVIAAGVIHTCAIVGSERSLRCFGDDSRWAIAPPAALALREVSSIDSKMADTCAISSGRVYCWGLLSGSSTIAIPLAADAEEVAAGEAHACARLDDGSVWCWPYGQVPERVAADGVVQIEAGSGFTCARRPSGEIICWGANGYVLDPRFDWTSPRSIAGVGGSIELSAGAFGACSVDAEGAAFCWGDNSHGQVDRDPPYARVAQPIVIGR